MLIRIFGSDFCERCSLLINGLNLLKINYEFIDANDPKNDDICDRFNVDALPHVQFVDNDRIVWEKMKSVSVTDIFIKAKHYGIK